MSGMRHTRCVPIMAPVFAGLLLLSCGRATTTSGTKVVDQRSLLTIRPMLSRLPSPCPIMANAHLPAMMLPEMREGVAVACYQFGAAVVDAKDFTNATTRMDPSTHLWLVGVSTTPDATDRMSAMARQVGIGGQSVIVVDGAVTGAPRWDSTEFPGVTVITGLAAQRAADGLAKRINHP